jgi:hypothetical protein
MPGPIVIAIASAIIQYGRIDKPGGEAEFEGNQL